MIYRVEIAMPVYRSQYIVKADGFDEAAEKAWKEETKDGGRPAGIKKIEPIGDDVMVLL